MNPIERIHVSASTTRAWVTVTRHHVRRHSRLWSRNYDSVTPASLARAQRAQMVLAGMEADAEFIVQACNTHDKLLEAVIDMVTQYMHREERDGRTVFCHDFMSTGEWVLPLLVDMGVMDTTDDVWYWFVEDGKTP